MVYLDQWSKFLQSIDDDPNPIFLCGYVAGYTQCIIDHRNGLWDESPGPDHHEDEIADQFSLDNISDMAREALTRTTRST